MRTKTLAAVGALGVVAVAAFLAGSDLRNDRDAWRTPYVNYMAGFISGADYVSSLVPGRKSQVDLLHEVLANHSRADDAVFALLENGNPVGRIGIPRNGVWVDVKTSSTPDAPRAADAA